ncbi:hypothetical protein K488DRAFT_69124 [Vararia minispora EC-137]|uniref:Uncharacterized protein n=1 Tax=Vararia minispora EC-137 TaxID=1314806 RepID=A0ACB8QSC9_9AGAM|nr:hypothetical protein K488DRAFT_69124 [Vararia minispora EC-137]
MHDNLDHLHRRAVHRRQVGGIFPGGNSVPKFPPASTTSSQSAPTPQSQLSSSTVSSTSSSSSSLNLLPTRAQSPYPTFLLPEFFDARFAQLNFVVIVVYCFHDFDLDFGPLIHLDSGDPPVIVYQTSSASLGAAAASASVSATAAPTSGTSTGVIIGGVAAGVVAAIGILFGIFYFMRRRGRDEDDVLGNWDPDAARRQSQMMQDPEPTPPSVNMYSGGSSLRPPTMIERHVNNASPMLARQHSMGQPYNQPMPPAFDHNGFPIDNGYPVATGYGTPVNYGPGPDEYMHNVHPSGNPFMAPYEQTPMGSPISSTVPHYDSHVQEPSVPQSAVTRQPSQLSSQQSLPGQHEEDSYADLSRSSVTPFQAQQYAEINHKLNAPALGAVAEEHPAPPPAVITPGQVSPTHASPSQPITRSSPPVTTEAKRPDTMYSAIYDEEDAYGGI